MPAKVQQYCQKTGQTVPQSKGEIIRCISEPGTKYRWSFEKLEEILGKKFTFSIVGGTKNRLLNQFTANVLNKPVICGPVEATAIGNLMVQAMALGEVAIRQKSVRSSDSSHGGLSAPDDSKKLMPDSYYH